MYIRRIVVRKVEEYRLLSVGVWCVATERYSVRDGVKWELLLAAVLQKLTLCYSFLAVCVFFSKVCILRSDTTFKIGQTKRVIPCSRSLYYIFTRARVHVCACARLRVRACVCVIYDMPTDIKKVTHSVLCCGLICGCTDFTNGSVCCVVLACVCRLHLPENNSHLIPSI